MSHTRSMLATFILLLFALPTPAQVQTGTPPFGSFAGGPDVINLETTTLTLRFRFVAGPGAAWTSATT